MICEFRVYLYKRMMIRIYCDVALCPSACPISFVFFLLFFFLFLFLSLVKKKLCGKDKGSCREIDKKGNYNYSQNANKEKERMKLWLLVSDFYLETQIIYLLNLTYISINFRFIIFLDSTIDHMSYI